MTLLADCPTPPDFHLPWTRMHAEYDWLRALDACPQDPIHHAEGDVGTHTRMVCEELVALPAWRALPETDRQTLFAAAVLHDVAKPECTRIEDGRIRSPGHAVRGAIRARVLLWQMGVPFAQREAVCGLIRHHLWPYMLIDRPAAVRTAVEISQTANCSHLAILAEADVRGRICADRERLLENVALFVLQAEDLGISTSTYSFATDHARVLFFQKRDRPLEAPAHEEFRSRVVLMSGMPGVGKDHYLREHLPGVPVIALDELREELEIAPDDEQGPVIQAARDRARDLLRRGEPFAWNATNISRQLRRLVLDLLLRYQAHVRICYLETSPETLARQNQNRSRRVPERVMDRLLDRWETPDLTEAHEVEYRIR